MPHTGAVSRMIHVAQFAVYCKRAASNRLSCQRQVANTVGRPALPFTST